ncbi:protein kinase [Mycolicibacterium fluoranthenivorans]|uniref:non-specific serine/threonine protein kinase n=1 Tax=Mycolicibacterium fluoranthenivorans TaxID=258505 RepID=A0A7G8P7Z5_9MYCO|nr:serine/threonine-protein kinase [Mycolicibacterium fluoranthenivorans]QNJ90461.1 protein kinase [Mycolicibacterium fluoranthenivorans]
MKCAEPGCDGTIVDGYCDLCGTAPAVAPAPQEPAATAAAPRGGTSSATRGSASVRSARTARTGSSRSGSSRGRLGAGVVAMPRIPKGDPTAAIMVDPTVPEGSRFCGNPGCHKPVGRGRDGSPGRPEGFCTACGSRYSFVPMLSAGDIVGGQYEVQGCLAHGGLGWIYLAIDRNVHNRWVVLKGLLNSGDKDAMAAAAAEVLALAEVEHPSIVRIYNFVQHPDPSGVPVGFIVMEYVGGTSLKQIRKARGGPLPPDQAVAYIVEIAPALDFLHGQGLAYCDFKPDNVMQTDEQLKLIDLGAVIAMDDQESAIYGTVGYQAPEIARTGPTVASDVYTVGRTLAVLVMDVPQEKGHFVAELPGPDTVPVLARHESLHLALLRATDPDPTRRFPSMAELTDQLTGVLHEIVAADGLAAPRVSLNFSQQGGAYGIGRATPSDRSEVIAALPVPAVDPADPGAALLATTSGTPTAQLEQALQLAGDRADSVEIPLRLARAELEMRSPAAARKRLGKLDALVPGDWRLPWYRGQIAVLEGNFDSAAAEFETVLATLPGELAPKLALAAVAELSGALDGTAARYYDIVWSTDHGYVSAAFGLARRRARAGDRAGAIAVLDEVPPASAYFTAAGATAIEVLLDGRTAADLDEQTLVDAGSRASTCAVESSSRRALIDLQVLGAALGWLEAGHTPTAGRLLGHSFDIPGIRSAMERCYRDLAQGTRSMWERIDWVEKANKIRPRTRV